MRLHEASSGEVLFDGKDLLARCRTQAMMQYKRRIQIVFQNPYASLNPRFTVGQILMEPLQIHRIGRERARAPRPGLRAVRQEVGPAGRVVLQVSARVLRAVSGSGSRSRAASP